MWTLKRSFKTQTVAIMSLPISTSAIAISSLASWSGTDSPTVLTQSPPWWSWKHPQLALVGCTCVCVCVICVLQMTGRTSLRAQALVSTPLHAPPLQYLYLWEPAPSMSISPIPSIFCLLHCKTRISSFMLAFLFLKLCTEIRKGSNSP